MNRILCNTRSLGNIGCRRLIGHVTVFGGGLMGSGIAQVSAQSGKSVLVLDQTEDILKNTQKIISTSVNRIAKKKFKDATPNESESWCKDVFSRITYSTDVGSAAKTDLVIEAIIENMDIKQKLFKNLDDVCQKSSIFTSNTSSLPITEIASSVSAARKTRFGGLHFFNPVPLMKLVEVVRIADTTDSVFDELMTFSNDIGKVAIKCKDTPGFVVNRLLIPYMNQALLMLDRGDATPQDIDIGMKLGASMPMGPFELGDYVGLDTMHFILEGWRKRFPDDPSFKESKILNKLIKEGKLGRKTGEGFYKYTK